MKLYILDKDYNRLQYIDAAESVLWNKKYNDIGECEIYIPYSSELIDILKIDHYVYREDDDMFCKIEKVDIETNIETGDYIIATGKDICNILSGRIIRWEIGYLDYNKTVFDFIKKILTDNVIAPMYNNEPHVTRQINNFVFDDSNSELFKDDLIETKAYTEDLLQLIITICKSYNIGFRVTYDITQNKLVFKLYKGVDRSSITNETYVEFSPTYSNIISSKYKVDATNYKNVVYVGYKANEEDEILTLLSYYDKSIYGDEEPKGEVRKEIYVDGSSISRKMSVNEFKSIFPTATLDGIIYYVDGVAVAKLVDNDDVEITNANSYLLLIRALAHNTLLEHTKTKEFDGEVDTINSYVYKIDYNIGDIVFVKNEYGIEAQARIIEIMESEDSDNGPVCEPRFEYIN